MNTTIGCPIPGASQPKEPMRLIGIKEILQYDGAHFTWSGGRNCLTEQKAAYARGYDAGMKFIVDEAKKAPIIDPEALRPTGRWELHGNDDDTESSYWCSNCNAHYAEDMFYPDGYVNGHWKEKPFSYCPNYGARMVTEDERKEEP